MKLKLSSSSTSPSTSILSYCTLVFIILLNCSYCCDGRLIEGIYCGKSNCYDVLGVTRESTRTEIAKSYRVLAKKYHPDLHRDPDAKKEASEQFKTIANAYEILKDEDSRNDYDYMLDNPDEYYAHYYRYYRRRVSPKVDVRLVLIVTISIISIIQYYSAQQRYEAAIKYFLTVPKYRNKAMEIIQKNGAEQNSNGHGGGGGGGKAGNKKSKLSKHEQKELSERMIRDIIIENMDIKGAYAKPQFTDILWMQILMSPYTITKYFIWYTSWIWNFTIMKKSYGNEQKLYLIRKFMGMGVHQFNGIEEDKKQEYLTLELWIKDNFKLWKKEQEEELKLSMADNPRYKQYRRYMKNNPPSRMTFED